MERKAKKSEKNTELFPKIGAPRTGMGRGASGGGKEGEGEATTHR